MKITVHTPEHQVRDATPQLAFSPKGRVAEGTEHEGALILGLVFFVGGILVLFFNIWFQTVPEDFVAPLSLIVGAVTVILSVQQGRRYRAHQHLKREHPDDVCIHDYPWNRAVAVVDFEAKARTNGRYALTLALAGSIFIVGGLSIVGQPEILIVFGALMLLAAGVFAWQSQNFARQHQRYGRSEFRFDVYPYFIGETLEGRWWSEKPLGDFDAVRLQLHCLEECREETIDGESLVTKEIYSQLASYRQRTGQTTVAEFRSVSHFPRARDMKPTSIANCRATGN